MGKIILLDENTSNKIAAGEVIERPASVVKELVENSMDAGAGAISIEIKNGGISYIKITDNGSGIDEDDMELAFERHATSKIRKADDLDSITTMGFRGEALASIAAVSDVQVVSRTQKSSFGKLLHIRGGNIIKFEDSGCPVGTTFTIRELFYNTPARYKFLKKDTTEAGHISDIVSRIAMGNPNISFRFLNNGSNIIHTPGNNDLKSTIFSIYGKDIHENILPVEYSDNNIVITGYVGKPEIARSNRNYQSIFLNRRYIKSKIITSAIDEAYKTALMKNKYAFVVLCLNINPLFIDVNVHPSKMEVRFSNEQDIFISIYNAISSALMRDYDIRSISSEIEAAAKLENKLHNTVKGNAATNHGKDLFNFDISKSGIAKHDKFKSEKGSNNIWPNLENDQNQNQYKILNREHIISKEPEKELDETLKKEEVTTSNYVIKETVPKEASIHEETNVSKEENLPKAANVSGETNVPKNEDITLEKYNQKSEVEDYDNIVVPQQDSLDENCLNENELQNDFKKNNYFDNSYIENTNLRNNIEGTVNENKFNFSSLHIIGQAFLTYIILEDNNELYIIDQHAAHERILYEQLKRKHKNKELAGQLLLSPVLIELTYQEQKLVMDNIEFMRSIGFDFEPFGSNTVLLRSVPFTGETRNIKKVFHDTVDMLAGSLKQSNIGIADEILYSLACKSAVKANKKLDELEIKNLIKELDLMGNIFTCPHGRPIVIKVGKNDIEKMFKR